MLRPLADRRCTVRRGDEAAAARARARRACGSATLDPPDGARLPASTVAYGGEPRTYDDPYRYLPTLGEVDLHLIGEGRHEQLWTVLGAHVRTYDEPA